MTLPIIQSLWIGDPLSKFERLCVQSFLDNGHEFHLYVYDDVGNIPDGATVKDANAILSRDLIFRNDTGGVSGFSNWFRYEMLVKYGGIWADMDMVCLKPFAFGDELVVGHTDKNADSVETAVVGGRSELWAKLSDACRRYPKIQKWDDWQTRRQKIKRRLQFRGREGVRFMRVGGPPVLAAAMRYFDLIQHVKPYTYFYPIHQNERTDMFDDTYAGGYDFGDATYGLHLWNEYHRQTPGFDKNADFPRGSLIEQLKHKHNIT